MIYSSAGIIALIIHFIINYDVLSKKSRESIVPAYKQYRNFLYAVTGFYISDILWGILYENKLINLVNIDTAIYFIMMALSILFWSKYVVSYLNEKNRFGQILAIVAKAFFFFEIFVVILNFFVPVLYHFDAEGLYHANYMRYLTLTIQIVIFALSSIYAFYIASRTKSLIKTRHIIIGLFSLTMGILIFAQTCYPLLPLYTIGCTLGCCALHSFILENEREEYRDNLEKKLNDSILKGNYYDLLTGLSGMTYFFENINIIRQKLFNEEEYPLLMFVDLKGMKYYNERYGFSKGDELLISLANLLIKEFGKESCCRAGQDRFLVFTLENNIEGKLDYIFKEWNKEGNEDRPIIRIGIYKDNMGNVDIAVAYDRAKVARDSLRNSYTNEYCFYDEAMQINAKKQNYIVSHLDRAINEKWIETYYMPIIRATNGRVSDEEALARWNDPELGLLTPNEFIPILESANLVYKVDLYMLENVLEKIKQQKESGLYVVPQSINLSRSDFDCCDMVEEIRRRVDDKGIDHKLISIEITESIIGSDFEFIKKQIERFRDLGFPVWLDDFGSGYSSLDVLQDVKVDLIKFDMSFMRKFDNGDKSKIILTELMKMAIAINVDTICEGVERADQVEFLREIGCSKLQGYYYCQPISFKTILKRYETGTQIGFENPFETDYYNRIDRINLYDLAVLSKDQNDLRGYFSTIPIGIVEIQKDNYKVTRSNQAYRDFLMQYYNFDLMNNPEGSSSPNVTFLDLLKRCEKGENKIITDIKLPDNEVCHLFLRRIAHNDMTDTTAIVIAILAIS